MPLDCPRCEQILLEEIEVGEVLVDRCPRCAGIWFDNAEIGRVAGNQQGKRNIDSSIPPPPTASDAVLIDCPRCSDVHLREMSFMGNDGRTYTLFRCISCIGTWMDRGELRDEEDADLDAKLKRYFSKLG